MSMKPASTMQKVFVLVTFLLLNCFSSSSQLVRDRIQQRRAEKVEQEQVSSNPPLYSDLFFWAAHPQKKDNSDSIPLFLAGEKRDTLADVFFLHPTTYTKGIGKSQWNADLDDRGINDATDMKTILYQASVFNNCCRIFAPRYRQAHLKAYFAPKSEASQKAFDLAYEDLAKAFQYYLDHYNNGRPIVIASHSQGAMHAIRLLKEFFDGKPLQKQLVCAYIVGWQIKKNEFADLKPGDSPSATGCVVGWRSYKWGETDFITSMESGNSVCVNPITWTHSSAKTVSAQHKGAVGKDFNKVYRNFISAMVEPQHNILWVQLPDSFADQYGKMKNYHIADYNLFYLDIRENVLTRVKAFLEKK